jgi:hypothetical protein
LAMIAGMGCARGWAAPKTAGALNVEHVLPPQQSWFEGLLNAQPCGELVNYQLFEYYECICNRTYTRDGAQE